VAARAPSRKLVFTTLSALFFGMALAPLVSAYVVPNGGCPNPPSTCTVYVKDLTSSESSSATVTAGGAEATLTLTASAAVPAVPVIPATPALIVLGAGNPLKFITGTGASGGLTVGAVGANMTFTASFHLDPSLPKNATVTLRIMVNPHIPGVNWTGPIDKNVTINATSSPQVVFPFKVTPDALAVTTVRVPFYLISHDGDPQKSTLWNGALYFQVAKKAPFSYMATLEALGTALLLARRRRA
jgi:hypothetical protein